MVKEQKSKEQELYDPFKDDCVMEYQEEAEQRWGNTEAYTQSMQRIQKITKEGMVTMKEKAELLVQNLARNMELLRNFNGLYCGRYVDMNISIYLWMNLVGTLNGPTKEKKRKRKKDYFCTGCPLTNS